MKAMPKVVKYTYGNLQMNLKSCFKDIHFKVVQDSCSKSRILFRDCKTCYKSLLWLQFVQIVLDNVYLPCKHFKTSQQRHYLVPL